MRELAALGAQSPPRVRETWRYGVFQMGDLWCVVSEDRAEMSFPDREGAMAAANLLKSCHRASGDGCELLGLDDAGRLVPL